MVLELLIANDNKDEEIEAFMTAKVDEVDLLEDIYVTVKVESIEVTTFVEDVESVVVTKIVAVDKDVVKIAEVNEVP